MTDTTDSAPVGNPQAEGVIYVQGVPTIETRLTLAGTLSVSPMAIGTWAWGVGSFSVDPNYFPPPLDQITKNDDTK